MSKRTVYLETFGCQMNVLDSQLVKTQLRALGYEFIEDWQQADVVLYNTCSVREQAENKVWSRVGIVGKHKKNRPDLILGVLGCMAEREGIDMVKRYPQIDFLVGPGELDKTPLLIDNIAKTQPEFRGGVSKAQTALQGNNHRRSATFAAAEDQLEMLDLARAFSPDEHQGSAYVRITRGCNKFCTYCVVPNTRGREVHRPPSAIIDECKRLVDAGVIEITLLGQTVNHYHFDHAQALEVNGVIQPQIGAVVRNDGTSAQGLNGAHKADAGRDVTTFAQLLRAIHDQVPGLQRLRFVTSFPRDFGDDILDVMAECPRICRYLHLPAQTGSNSMLQKMNRGYTVEQYLELVQRIRTKLPDAMLAGDIICGFPGETDEDHQATVELLKQVRYKNCFIFKYSPRPGTAAIDRFEDDVPDEVKRRRNNELLAIQNEISKAIHEVQVGKRVRVFVESISHREEMSRNSADPAVLVGWEKKAQVTQLTGRTDGDLIVMLDGDENLVGQIVEVEIYKAATLTLFGRLVEQPEPAMP